MVSIEEIKKMDHKTKIRIGLVMGIFCALYWGVWYVPGYAVWDMSILTELPGNMEAAGWGGDVATVSTAVFLTGMNAIFCALVLFIWNGALGKLPEFKRERLYSSREQASTSLWPESAVPVPFLEHTLLHPI